MSYARANNGRVVSGIHERGSPSRVYSAGKWRPFFLGVIGVKQGALQKRRVEKKAAASTKREKFHGWKNSKLRKNVDHVIFSVVLGVWVSCLIRMRWSVC